MCGLDVALPGGAKGLAAGTCGLPGRLQLAVKEQRMDSMVIGYQGVFANYNPFALVNTDTGVKSPSGQ